MLDWLKFFFVIVSDRFFVENEVFLGRLLIYFYLGFYGLFYVGK